MASDDWPSRKHNVFLHDGWSHQILTRLLLLAYLSRGIDTRMSAAWRTSRLLSTHLPMSTTHSLLEHTPVRQSSACTTGPHLFREHFQNVPQFKRFLHYSFSTESRRVVSLKEYNDSTSTTLVMLFEEWQPAAIELPKAITPAGVPLAR